MTFITHVAGADLHRTGFTRHQQVMSLFPADLPGGDEARALAGILFLETGDRIVVRSLVRPVNIPGDGLTRQMADSYVPASGTVIRFKTAVNAVTRPRVGSVSPVEDVEGWLALKVGAALEDVTVLAHDRKLVHSGRSPLQVDMLDGQAVVGDREVFRELLSHGIGRAKAYGCGLMLVAA